MIAARLLVYIGLAYGAAACTDDMPVEPPYDSGVCFIAVDHDFADFATWSMYSLGDAPIDGHPVGPRFGYLSEKAPRGWSEYSIGMKIVKLVQSGATPQDWDLFGMVKRGCDYNPKGAVSWEFFTMKLDQSRVPVVLTRGSNPSEVVLDADAGFGHGYAAPPGTTATCNRCHGVLGTERTDRVLSALLAPGTQ